MSRVERLLPEERYPLVLFTLPWLLLALNPNWPFGNAANLDPWIYWTHFRTYPALQVANPGYYGERLPMILPGYLVHHFFTPLVAQVFLHVAFFYVAVCSLYYIIKTVHDRPTALLSATLLGCHSFFIGAIGHDYIDGYGIAYYLLALALLTRSLRSTRPELWLVLAGATSANCFYINPIWALFMPFFPFYYLIPTWNDRGQTVWSALAVFTKFFLIGFTGSSVLLGVLSYFAVGTFWFYKGSLTLMLTLKQYAEWTNPNLSWMTKATWLVFPLIVFIASLASVLRTSLLGGLAYVSRSHYPASEARGVLAPLFLANFFYCCLAMSYLAFIRKNRVLEFDFYANVLIPSMFLALGTGIFVLPKPVDMYNFLKTLATTVVICLLPLWLRWRYVDLPGALPFIQPTSAFLKYYLVLPATAGSGALLLKVLLPQHFTIWRLAVLTFSLIGFGLVPSTPEAVWCSPYHGAALFSRVERAFDIVRMQTDPNLKKLPFVWYNPAGPNAYDYYALSSALRRGIGFGLDVSFPALNVPTAAIPPDCIILILTENKDIPSAAEGALRQKGLTGKVISQAKVADNEVSYWMTFLQVIRVESTLAAQR